MVKNNVPPYKMVALIVAPVIVAAVYAAALGLKWKYGGDLYTMFDIFVMFCSIALYSIFEIVFYDKVVSKLRVTVSQKTVSDFLDLDPSGQARSYLDREIGNVDVAAYNAALSSQEAQNQVAIRSDAVWWFFLSSIVIAGVSLAMHVGLNFRNRKWPMRPVEAVICVTLLAVFIVELLLYYLVIRRSNFFYNTDLVSKCLDQLRQTLSRNLIAMWNGDENLRNNLKGGGDLSNDISAARTSITDLQTEIVVILPSVQALSMEKAQIVTQGLTALQQSLEGCDPYLTALSENPCQPGDVLSASTGTPVAKIGNLQDVAKAVQALDQLSGSSGRADVDVLLQNIIDSCQPMLEGLQRLSSADSCNTYARVRAILTDLQKDCSAGATYAAPSLGERLASNPNAMLIALAVILFLAYMVAKMAAHDAWFSIASVSCICLCLVVFQFLFVSFAMSGSYKTPMDLGNPQFVWYTVMQ